MKEDMLCFLDFRDISPNNSQVENVGQRES